MYVCVVVVYHYFSVIYIPAQRREAPVSEVDHRILDDVNRTRKISREDALGPARETIGLRQEPPGQEEVIRRHLAEDYILRQNMSAERNTFTVSYSE